MGWKRHAPTPAADMDRPLSNDLLAAALASGKVEKVVEYRWRPSMKQPHRDYIRVYIDGMIAWDGPRTQDVLEMIDKARAADK